MADQNFKNIPLTSEPPKKPEGGPAASATFQQYNGINSSHSSRSSSPSLRSGQIPASQLPPSRPIPQTQLPPSRSPLTMVTQQVAGLSMAPNTPSSTQKFTTSTPTMQSPQVVGHGSPFSPVMGATGNMNSNQSIPQNAPVSCQSYFSQPPEANQTPSTTMFPRSVTTSSQSSSANQQILPSSGQAPLSSVPTSASVPPKQIQNPPSFNQHSAFSPQVSNPNLASQRPAYGQSAGTPASSMQMPPNSTMNNLPRPVTTNPLMGKSNPPTPSYGQPPKSVPPITNNHNYGPVPCPGTNPTSNYYPNQPTPMANHQPSPNKNAFPPQASPPMNGNQTNAPQNCTNSNHPPNASVAPPPQRSPFTMNGPQQQHQQPQYGVQNSYTNGTPQGPTPQRTGLHANRYPAAAANAAPPGGNVQQQYAYPQKYQQQNTYNNYGAQQPSYPQQQQTQSPQQQSYQQQSYQQQQQTYQQYKGVTQTGFNKMWGMESHDLLQTPTILPPKTVDPPKIILGQEAMEQANCSPDILRCTMTKIPENNNLLQKSRLPLGVLIHPFKDLSHLPVIQCNVIVRCRACRTYINPFVFFVDSKRWKCNLCYRVNELPEEFQYDPVTKTYGDPSRRPEIKSSTLEYIAPAEYMLRPPQPAVYLYLLDVSRLAVESGYLGIMCDILQEELENIPGDARTQIGFVAYDSVLHFYALPEDASRPHEMTVLDIDEVFLPTPDNLLVNLKDKMEMVKELLQQLPHRYANTYDSNSALGAALQAAFKLMGATGGRVTVFQASLPNVGPGALVAREDPTARGHTQVDTQLLNPANDFYKRLALECSGQQIAVDLFVVNSTYVDIATISGISRFSGGCIHHFPLLRPNNMTMREGFSRSFRRYLTRKIGFEAVMRIRCTRGLAIHSFHGNFFVRSTDLLSLPNINPDAGFGMQVSIEDNLSDVQTVCFQAALLYTSSKGERRIRVHTLCLPVTATLQDVIHSADQECVVGLLAKMAVDRSMQANVSDAREAFINVAIDILSSYKMSLNMSGPSGGLLAPTCLKLLPLYISAIMKHTAFRTGIPTRIDDRVMAMIEMKTKPLHLLMQMIYPDLYQVHDLENQQVIMNSEDEPVSLPPKLQLSARWLDCKGVFLLDAGDHMVMLVCQNASAAFLTDIFEVASYAQMPDDLYDIPSLDNLRNQRLRHFICYLNEDKPYPPPIHVIRDNSSNRALFYQHLVEDRMENALSYHEFLQHLKTQVK
nr:unnamed protein product [Callosobruchus analis]